MPMEMIMDLTLLALYEPTALSEEVIAHIFAQIEGLYNLFGFQLLLVRSNIHYHRAFAAVTFDYSE